MQAVSDAATQRVFAIDRRPLADASIPLTSLSPRPKRIDYAFMYVYTLVNTSNGYTYIFKASTNEYGFQESGEETKSAPLFEKGRTDSFSFRFF
jgi:hypothetical protein